MGLVNIHLDTAFRPVSEIAEHQTCVGFHISRSRFYALYGAYLGADLFLRVFHAGGFGLAFGPEGSGELQGCPDF